MSTLTRANALALLVIPQVLEDEIGGVSELSLSPLRNGGARNAMEERVVKPRLDAGSHLGSSHFPNTNTNTSSAREKKSKSRMDGSGTTSGAEGIRGREPATGLASRLSSAAAGKNDRRRLERHGAVATTAVTKNRTDGNPNASLAQPRQQQPPAKKRRNLDFGKGKAGARDGAGPPVARRSIELFFPQYGGKKGNK